MSLLRVEVAVSGGPCSGKTTLLSLVEPEFQKLGWDVYVFEEPATELIKKGLPIKEAIEQGNLPLLYDCELKIARLCLKNRMRFRRRAKSTGRRSLAIYDRMIPDNYPYFPEGPVGDEMYERMLGEFNLLRAEVLGWFRGVVKLTTAADGAPESYTLDNNEARTEALEEAIRLDRRFELAYADHPNLIVIDNSTGFEEKMARALAAIHKIVDQ